MIVPFISSNADIIGSSEFYKYPSNYDECKIALGSAEIVPCIIWCTMHWVDMYVTNTGIALTYKDDILDLYSILWHSIEIIIIIIWSDVVVIPKLHKLIPWFYRHNLTTQYQDCSANQFSAKLFGWMCNTHSPGQVTGSYIYWDQFINDVYISTKIVFTVRCVQIIV